MERLLENVIQKYKSLDFIKNIDSIEAEVSASGLAFLLKRRQKFTRAKLFMNVKKSYCKITPIGEDENISAVLSGHDVWLEDKDGNIIQKRENAKEYFDSFDRNFSWDDLDMAYFANYAFWNYFTFSTLLVNPYIYWKQIGSNTLEATFFYDIPTHSKVQQFHFNDEALLVQHDYSADVISTYATAANKVKEHKEVDGYLFGVKRIVTPRFNNFVLPRPILIDIDVHDIKLNYK